MSQFSIEPSIGQSPIERMLADLKRKQEQLERSLNFDTGWITPTLLNNWVNYGGAYVPTRYRRKNGIVYIQGLVKNGSGVIFVLPVGFRPLYNILIAGIEGTNTICRTDIESDGDVLAAAGASNAFWSINAAFPAEA